MARIAAIVLMVVLAAVSVTCQIRGRYCTRNRVVRERVIITYLNPCPYRGNYISRRYVIRTKLVPQRVCCDGWTGCYCHIPICRNCGDFQKCVAPNICDCQSRRFVPVNGNRQCSLAVCTTDKNCYPGTCLSSGQCACSSGFGGDNCQSVEDTSRYRKCELVLRGRNFANDLVEDKIDGQCKEDEIVVDQVVKDAYSRLRVINSIKLNWVAYYAEPRDLPNYPPYISYSLPGIIYAATIVIPRQGSPRRYICYDGRVENKARLTAMCNRTQSFVMRIPHDSNLNISMYTRIGGYKQYKATDVAGQYLNQNYTGLPAYWIMNIKFDSQAPVHCLMDPGYLCMRQGNIPDPEPIFAGIDATTDPDITFYWAGWYDSPSEIDDYSYSIWQLQYVNGTLVPHGPPDVRGTWTPGPSYPSIKATQPSLISAVLNVTDVAGNRARAHTLVLYAPDSSLEADPANPIRVLQAPGGGRWVNSLGVARVTLLYSGHFINKVFQEYKLLAPVQQPTDIKYYDNLGNITSRGLGPTEGIKMVNYTYGLSSPNLRKKRQAQLASSSASQNDLENQWVNVPFNPTADGDTLRVDLTVADVMNNIMEETVLVGLDSSAPVVDQSGKFEGNTNREIGGRQHFTSSFVARAVDPHSGVTSAQWTASQPGKSVQGTHHILPLESDQCQKLGSNCICTPLGDCYDADAEVLIDNCELAKLDDAPFDLDVIFLNNASLSATKITRKIDPYKISGPGEHPHVVRIEPLTDQSKPTEAVVRWQLPHTCDTLTRIRIEYSQTDTETVSQLLGREAENTTLSGLHAQRDSTVTVILVYENDIEAPLSATFVTPATALGFTSSPGKIAGAVIGLIILVLLLILLLLLLLIWFYRKRNAEEKPKFIAVVEDKMEDYGVLKVIREKIYGEVDYTPRKVAKKLDDNMYDEVDIYHKMGPPTGGPATKPGYDISTIVLGSGSMCIIKRANLRDASGSKAVAAKMLKGGKGKDGKLLMEAKINYLARVPKHENIVNYISSDKEVPIIFLELCGMGTLLDFVKRLDKLTPDDNDKLLGFSQDITAGIKHLHENNIVHRRMAAHNILLANGTDRPIAKITGFGPLPSDHGYSNKKIPARWMAPELLGNPPEGQQRPYTSSSDMWSWGVTMWEIFSLGKKPYEDAPLADLKRLIIEGERLPQPQYCADTLYEQLMKPCWKLTPAERATADHIYTRLDTFVNGSQTNHGYYGEEEAAQTMDDNHVLENEQNRERIYSNTDANQPYDDPVRR